MMKRHAGLFWLCWVLVFGVTAGCQPAFATVSTTAPRNDYVGNGATATYSYSFKIFAATDLRVTKRDTNNVETTLTYTTDYTVTGVGSANGGTITLTAGALAQDYALTIRFDRTPRQSTDLRNQGSFYPEVHEDKFDELTRYAQQNKDTLDRSLHLPETEVGTAAKTTIPVAAERADKYLGFDSSGNPTAVANTVSGTSVTATGSTTARTLAERFADFGNVKDHGAVGDAVTSDTVDIKAAWTAADGGPIILPLATGYVFSGRFDGAAGDIGLSPLLPGYMGRFYHYYEPQYDLASDLLSVMHYFKTGSITIPALKQHNVMRFDGTVTNGAKFKGIDWQYTVTDTTDAYAAIALLINQGSGSTKALYGRAQASTGSTGVVVGVVAATTVDTGIVPSAAIGLEVSMDGAGSATEHSAIRIDTAEASNVIDYGLLSLSTMGYGNAFIKGFRRTGAGGNAFEWTDEATGRDLFAIDENGNVAIGSTNDPQKTLSFGSAATQYQMQAVTASDFFRIRDNTAGNNLVQLAGGGSTDPVSIRVNSTMKQVTEGAADSGGAGFRVLRVPN